MSTTLDSELSLAINLIVSIVISHKRRLKNLSLNLDHRCNELEYEIVINYT